MARGFRSVQQAPKRQYIWSNVLIFSAGTGIGTAKSTGALGALGVATSGATLVRTRGQLMFHMDTGAAFDAITVAVGLGIFSSDAFAAGAASLPGPITDVDYDWIYHRVALLESFSATESDASIQQNLQIELDSKAMRKMKPSQTMGFVFEGSIVAGAPTFDFSVAARQLFKLG